MKITRLFDSPNKNTFHIPVINNFLRHAMREIGGIWIDPFAGFYSPAHITNDLNPKTIAQHHMKAEDFVASEFAVGFDNVLFDPPYSPRQIKESYENVGLELTMKTTQNGLLYSSVRNALSRKLKKGAIVIGFGWNTTGFGKGRGFKLLEILIVNHGAAHNDTLVTVEEKINNGQKLLFEANQ